MKRIVLAALLGVITMGTVVYAADAQDNSLLGQEVPAEESSDVSLIEYWNLKKKNLP